MATWNSTSRTLKSTDHAWRLLTHIKALYQRHQMTDMVLVAEGREFKVHMVVLSAHSMFFQKMLNSDQKNERHELQNTLASSVETMVDFMYTGALQLDSANVWCLLTLAGQLQCSSMMELCQKFLALQFSSGELENMQTEESQNADESEPALESQPDDKDFVFKEEQEAAELDDTDNDPGWEPKEETVSPVRRRRGHPRKAQRVVQVGLQPTRRSKRKSARNKSIIATRADCEKKPTKKPAMAPISQRRKCHLCQRTFLHYSSMKLHQKLHGVGILQLQQKALGQVYLRLSLEDSLSTSSSSGMRFRCKQCDKNFKLYTLYQKHFLREHRPYYICSSRSCGAGFRVKTKLLLHQAKRHKTRGRTAKVELCSSNVKSCNLCRRSFVFKKNLTRHRAKAHRKVGRPRKDGQHMCRRCGDSFPNRQELRSHLHIIHLARLSDKHAARKNLPRAHCEECGAGFFSYTDLRLHVKETHPAVSYPCRQCAYYTPIKLLLERHVQRRHNKDKNYDEMTCEVCLKQFPNKSRLLFHRYSRHSLAHPDLKLYPCDTPECSYQAFSNWDLMKHAKRHTRTKSLPCDRCNRRFKTQEGLNHHVESQHMNIRPHICETCAATFSTELDLKAHVKTHSNVKQFKCDHCDYCTHLKESLRQSCRAAFI